MFNKLILVFFMAAILVGASTTSTPFPVLLVMGVLVFFAFFAALRREQPE